MTGGQLLDLALPRTDDQLIIATLGPAGTSSQAAATTFAARITHEHGVAADTDLYETYEGASAAVLGESADLLVVANAYASVDAFYMNPDLSLAAAFVQVTPEYGIAVPRPDSVPRAVRVATHPAPRPLIAQLLPESMSVRDVVMVHSTSAAAAATRAATVDAALTTAPAAHLHDLTFISRTRVIQMLWSVFCRAAVPRAVRPAAGTGR